jgi:hypothetical protein
MNKGQLNCEMDDCTKYVKYRISQKGRKIQEESNCSGIFSCLQCESFFCVNHVKIHMNQCKGSVGYRNAVDQ